MATVTTTFNLVGQRRPLAGVSGITEGAAPYAWMDWELELGSIPATGAGDNQRWQVLTSGPDNSFYALTWASFRILRGAGASWDPTDCECRAIASESNVWWSIPARVVTISTQVIYADPEQRPGFLVTGEQLYRADNNDANQGECFLSAYVRALMFSRDQAEYWPPHTPLWTR